jgi:NHL repeat
MRSLAGVMKVRVSRCGTGGLIVVLLASTLASAGTSRGAGTSPGAGRVFTVAGALWWTGPRDEARLATAAAFGSPAISVTPDGGFLIADTSNSRVLLVHPDGRVTPALANPERGNPNLAPIVSLSTGEPGGIAALPHGGFLLVDTGGQRVLGVSRTGRISTAAGDGIAGFGGDRGPATRAKLFFPEGVAALPDGGFLIADTGNGRIRRVWADGHISTVAGTGRRDRFSGDGGPATRAALASPDDVASMPDGGFLVADTDNYRVRRVWPDGRISTVAGNGRDSTSGDGGPATSAAIGFLQTVAPMPTGGFIIGTDDDVRRVWPDGSISTVLGSNGGAFPGDGGSATQAELYGASGAGASVAALPDGGILVGYAGSVRLIVGLGGTALLAAAVRPLAGVASRDAYSARIVLTRPARLTIRIYGSMKGRPVAVFRASRPAGESTVTLPLGRNVTPGLYAIDVRARDGAQVTRAEGYVFLGGLATGPSIHRFANQLLAEQYNNDPNAYLALGRCHRFTAQRVDCSFYGDQSYVLATWLTRQGQLISRSYFSPIRHGRRVFIANPHWSSPAVWDDLGAAWNPNQFGY